MTAQLLDSARTGPLEDSGEMPGYEEMLKALANPSNEHHNQVLTNEGDLVAALEWAEPDTSGEGTRTEAWSNVCTKGITQRAAWGQTSR